LPLGLSAFVRCFGPLFTAASTARSKRCHASVCNSGSFGLGGRAMIDLGKDEWISNHYPSIAHKLHALGVVSLEWNRCEAGLFWLFSDVVSLPRLECWVLAYELGDIAISERIKALMKFKKYPLELIASVENVLEVYEICRRNRNQLTHFHVLEYRDDLALMRISKKVDSPELAQFANTLEDIRRVADEVKWLGVRLWVATIMLEEYRQKKTHGPLPPILLLPELLWKPPQQAPTGPPRPPRSSSASRRKAALEKRGQPKS
jgi:hypothetical protein